MRFYAKNKLKLRFLFFSLSPTKKRSKLVKFFRKKQGLFAEKFIL